MVATAVRTEPEVSVNEVRLRGRLAAAPAQRELPSGDVVSQFRVVVPRPPARHTRVPVDTVDCVAWSARLRHQLAAWSADDELELTGALRRRFWRTAGGAAASRYEVEVITARRVRRATMAG